MALHYSPVGGRMNARYCKLSSKCHRRYQKGLISIEVIGFALQNYILVHIDISFKIIKFPNLILLQFSQIEDMFSKIIQWFTANLLHLIRANELNEISL